MKRTFDCSHQGKGKFCHRCGSEQKAVLADLAAEAAREAVLAARMARPKIRPRKGPPVRDPHKVERLRKLKSAMANAPIDLSAAQSLPLVLERAVLLLEQLAAGTHPLALGGQKLTTRGGDFSVPVGQRHRILVDARSLKPLEFLSHEAYNGHV